MKTSLIHSILFEKENPKNYKWSETKAFNWLVKHKYYPIKVSDYENNYRFRIIDPQILYNLKAEFRTIDLDVNKGIKAVIAYVNPNNPIVVHFN